MARSLAHAHARRSAVRVGAIRGAVAILAGKAACSLGALQAHLRAAGSLPLRLPQEAALRAKEAGARAWAREAEGALQGAARWQPCDAASEEQLRSLLRRPEVAGLTLPAAESLSRELERLGVRELRALAAARGKSFRNVTEKRDLIMRLVETKVVQLVKEAPPKALDVDEAGMRATWSIKQLKRLMAEIGVDSTKCVEKAELVDHLVASGRVAFSERGAESKAMDVDDLPAKGCESPELKRSSSASSSPAADDRAAAEKRPRRPGAEGHDAKDAPRSLEFVPPPAAEGYCYREDDAAGSPPRPPRSLPPDDGPAPLLVFTRQELGDLSVRRLKDALELVGLADELRGCSEKAELRSLLANSGDVRILP